MIWNHWPGSCIVLNTISFTYLIFPFSPPKAKIKFIDLKSPMKMYLLLQGLSSFTLWEREVWHIQPCNIHKINFKHSISNHHVSVLYNIWLIFPDHHNWLWFCFFFVLWLALVCSCSFLAPSLTQSPSSITTFWFYNYRFRRLASQNCRFRSRPQFAGDSAVAAGRSERRTTRHVFLGPLESGRGRKK